MRISDWSSDVCSSDLLPGGGDAAGPEWPAWGGTNAGQRFSTLGQITPANVGDLKLAWTYRTGVRQPGVKSPLQTTPLMVDGTLYLCTQTNIVVALDPETGQERRRFEPKVDPRQEEGRGGKEGVSTGGTRWVQLYK